MPEWYARSYPSGRGGRVSSSNGKNARGADRPQRGCGTSQRGAGGDHVVDDEHGQFVERGPAARRYRRARGAGAGGKTRQYQPPVAREEWPCLDAERAGNVSGEQLAVVEPAAADVARVGWCPGNDVDRRVRRFRRCTQVETHKLRHALPKPRQSRSLIAELGASHEFASGAAVRQQRGTPVDAFNGRHAVRRAQLGAALLARHVACRATHRTSPTQQHGAHRTDGV
jgi:hypothetical protein